MDPVLITGANRGIGRSIALQIAARGAPALLLCRDARGAAAVVAEVEAAGGQARAVLADLADPEQVDRAVAELRRDTPRLGALVLNAGLWPDRLERDSRGLERSFVVNHLAPFQLVAGLWPLLAESRARIVCVSAGLYVFGRRDLDAVAWGTAFSRWRTYCDTKRCNAVFARELARRVAGTGVTVNAVHPGVINTGLGEGSGLERGLVRLWKRLLRSPEQGALGPVALAVDPMYHDVTGQYFNELKPEPWRAEMGDEAEAQALWEQSEALVGRRFEVRAGEPS